MSTNLKKVNKLKKNSRRTETSNETRFVERLIKLVAFLKLQKVEKN